MWLERLRRCFPETVRRVEFAREDVVSLCERPLPNMLVSSNLTTELAWLLISMPSSSFMRIYCTVNGGGDSSSGLSSSLGFGTGRYWGGRSTLDLSLDRTD